MIITMIKWIWTSRLSIKKSLSLPVPERLGGFRVPDGEKRVGGARGGGVEGVGEGNSLGLEEQPGYEPGYG